MKISKLFFALLVIFSLLPMSGNAQTKLSAIANGGSYNASTDKVVTVRSGTTDVLTNFLSIPAISSSTAFQFLTSNGTSLNWGTAAGFVDPRTYGASCVGPGYTGGLNTTNKSGIIVNKGTGYTNGTYTGVAFTGGSGSGGLGTIVVSGGVVTSVQPTTPGTGYKLRDQLSVASSSIGGTGSGLVYQVSRFSSNQTPVYDGVHDDTAAFQLAMAAAQNTGQAVLVPNGCWISTLNMPQGIAMVGEGYAVTYGYNMQGGTADQMPVLYIEGNPQFAIYLQPSPNDAFFGFELNGAANSGAYGTTYGIGTDQNGGGGDTKLWIYNMSFKNLLAGVGTPDNATMFAISHGSDYGANQYGIYGNLSDFDSSDDTFVSGGVGIYLAGGAGEVRITNDRFEYMGTGINIQNYGGIKIVNCDFDQNSSQGLLIGSSGSQVAVTGSNFQNNGDTGTVGNESDITLSRNTTAFPGVDLHISNTIFSGYGGNQPKYIIETTTAGANNDYIEFNGGTAINGYTVGFANWTNGIPPHVKIAIPDIAQLNTIDTTGSINSAGGMGIHTSTPSTLADLDVSGGILGILPPQGTTTQEPACSSTTAGLLRWNTTVPQLEFCNGSTYSAVASPNGAVTTTGSPASTYLARFSGSSTITGASTATLDSSGNVTALSLTASGPAAGNITATNTTAATSGTYIVASPNLTLNGQLWNGSASVATPFIMNYSPAASGTYAVLDFNMTADSYSSHDVQFKGENTFADFINSNDNLGAIFGETYQSAQFGLNNTSGSSQGIIGAHSQKIFFIYDEYGNVGTTQQGFPGSPAYRNLLDDGSASAKMGLGTTSPATKLDVYGAVSLSGKLTFSNTAPTISSGFGTSPTVATGSTATSFDITVGTSPGSSGVVTLPTATNAWVCNGTDVTTPSNLKMTAHTTTSATFTNYSLTTGVATSFTAADDLAISCTGH